MANLAYSLYYLGQRDEANTWVEKSLAIRPDGGLAITRWAIALRTGGPDVEKYKAAARKIAQADDMLNAEGAIAAWEGRLKDYRSILDQLITHARAAHNDERVGLLEASERVTFALYEGGPTIDALKLSLNPTAGPAAQAQAALALASLGQVD